jgi:Flp pilus assembly protein TadD
MNRRRRGATEPLQISEKLALSSQSGAEQHLALIYSATGRKNDADLALRQLEGRSAGVAAYDVATVLAYRGERDAAITWLERAYKQRDSSMVFLEIDPLLRNLHGNPRYRALMRKMNLPE